MKELHNYSFGTSIVTLQKNFKIPIRLVPIKYNKQHCLQFVQQNKMCKFFFVFRGYVF